MCALREAVRGRTLGRGNSPNQPTPPPLGGCALTSASPIAVDNDRASALLGPACRVPSLPACPLASPFLSPLTIALPLASHHLPPPQAAGVYVGLCTCVYVCVCVCVCVCEKVGEKGGEREVMRRSEKRELARRVVGPGGFHTTHPCTRTATPSSCSKNHTPGRCGTPASRPGAWVGRPGPGWRAQRRRHWATWAACTAEGPCCSSVKTPTTSTPAHR